MGANSSIETIPTASDFAEDKLLMEQTHQIILLEFMSDNCPYCKALEQNFLLPMIRSGEYEKKVLFRQILHDDPYGVLIDFNGKKVYHEVFSERYKIGLTPTMVFLGTDGQQLVERIVGLGPEDYFSYYIDEAIDEAIVKMWNT